jgi:cyclopropane fatty-acyl-phospholipid synthase-like methyltransferase
MATENRPYMKFDHDAYARTRAPDDFWGQVRRTVRGVPVSDEQIGMIVDTIRLALDIEPEDTLLDIACGNGALAQLLFDSCADYLGVDLSEHLISVAKANFEALPRHEFAQLGAAAYVHAETRPERFSKVLCYGSFPYFPAGDAGEVLRTLFHRFINVHAVFIGNLPDKDRAARFYGQAPDARELGDCYSPIGIWRTRDEFTQLAQEAGWEVKISTMPPGFYASHYRFDALLSRSA